MNSIQPAKACRRQCMQKIANIKSRHISKKIARRYSWRDVVRTVASGTWRISTRSTLWRGQRDVRIAPPRFSATQNNDINGVCAGDIGVRTGFSVVDGIEKSNVRRSYMVSALGSGSSSQKTAAAAAVILTRRTVVLSGVNNVDGVAWRRRQVAGVLTRPSLSACALPVKQHGRDADGAVCRVVDDVLVIVVSAQMRVRATFYVLLLCRMLPPCACCYRLQLRFLSCLSTYTAKAGEPSWRYQRHIAAWGIGDDRRHGVVGSRSYSLPFGGALAGIIISAAQRRTW